MTRRTRFDLRKAEERAHILEGYVIALDNIDEVIKVIRSAYNDAKEKLMDSVQFVGSAGAGNSRYETGQTPGFGT